MATSLSAVLWAIPDAPTFIARRRCPVSGLEMLFRRARSLLFPSSLAIFAIVPFKLVIPLRLPCASYDTLAIIAGFVFGMVVVAWNIDYDLSLNTVRVRTLRCDSVPVLE
ncbi:hypothetical protein BGZ57DRAFT_909798 [Hyaloscypha finlandica]|nr:hypothetical protein BGZ57DRAFT_909798 [Hyaloscypha finlandica]